MISSSCLLRAFARSKAPLETLSPLEAVCRSLASGPGWFRSRSHPRASFLRLHVLLTETVTRESLNILPRPRCGGTLGGVVVPPLFFLSGVHPVYRSRTGSLALLEMGRTLGPAGLDPSMVLEPSSDLPLLLTRPAATPSLL